MAGERAAAVAPGAVIGRDAEIDRLRRLLSVAPVVHVVGVRGVGKTTIVRATARRLTTVNGAGADGLLALAAHELSVEPSWKALADALEARRTTLLVSGAGEDSRRELVHELGSRLRDARLVLESSARLADGGNGPVAAELVLRTLSVGAAQRFWESLDRLGRPSSGFAAAWKRYGGNPAALRRAHAGELFGDPPLRDVVAGLSATARAAGRMLSLSPVPLPRALFANGEGTAVRELHAALLADVDATGAVALEPGAATELAGPPDEAAAAHEALLVRLLASGLPTPQIAPAIAAQLAVLGRYEELERHVSVASESLRDAHAWEALGALIDALPDGNRAKDVRRLRASSALACGDLHTAALELAALHDAEARLAHAAVRRRQGLLADADAELGTLLAEPLPPLLRTRVLAERALCAALRLEPVELGALPAAVAAVCDTFAEHCRTGRAPRRPAVTLDPSWLETFDGLPQLLPHGEGPAARAGAAVVALYAGDRFGADDALADAASALSAHGDRVAAIWAEIWRAHALLLLGREHAARVLFEAVEADLRPTPVPALSLLLHGTRERTLAAQLANGRVTQVFDMRRAAAVTAFAAGLSGSTDIEAVGLRLPEGDDVAVERLLHALARAASTRLRGNATQERAQEEAAEAARAAAAAGVDPELIQTCIHFASGPVIIRRDGRQILYPPDAKVQAGVVIDGRHHEVRFGDAAISLRRRVITRRLLYELARTPGRRVSRDRLAMAMWARAYASRVHDNPIKVNVSNLKKVLFPTGLTVRAEQSAYVLEGPADLAFIEAPQAET